MNLNLSELQSMYSFLRPKSKGIKFHIVLVLFFFANSFSVLGQDDCGLPDADEPDIKAFLNTLNTIATTASSTEYNIPLQFIIVNEDDGTPPTTDVSSATILDMVDEVNDEFGNDINFFICDIAEINSTAFYDLRFCPTSTSGITLCSGDEYAALYQTLHVDNAINVYIVNSISGIGNSVGGVGTAPWLIEEGVVLKVTGVNGLLAHELGHYFGLLHTHQNAVTLLPDNTWNPFFSEDICFCCDTPACPNGPGLPIMHCVDCNLPCDCNCANSGDYICDTPVDPGINNCSTLCSSNGCQIGTYLYTPDRTNIMSYYAACRDNFTPMQTARMIETLLDLRNELINNPPTSCTFFGPAKNGILNRVGQTGTSISLDPFEEFRIDVREDPGDLCIKVTDSQGAYNSRDCISTIESGSVDVGQHILFNQNNLAAYATNNGISVLDLIKLIKHLQTVELLAKPYAWLAADVSNNGAISILDKVKVEKILLGQRTEFENVPSWRLFPELALDDQWNFKTSFENDPFGATWQSPDGPRSYLATSNNQSYLDDVSIDLTDPIVSKEESWSFRAIKMGDVNFSADISSSGANQAIEKTRFAFNANIHSCLERGDEEEISFYVQNSERLNGLQLGVSYDPSMIEVSTINNGTISRLENLGFNIDASQTGKILLLWTHDFENRRRAPKFNENKSLLTFKIKALEEICDIGAAFEVDQELMEPLFFNEADQIVRPTLVLDVGKNNNDKNKLLRVFPNPTSKELSFHFFLKKSGKVTIKLIDTYRNILQYENDYDPGSHTYIFDNLQSLSSNVIYYSVDLDGVLASGKAVKTISN